MSNINQAMSIRSEVMASSQERKLKHPAIKEDPDAVGRETVRNSVRKNKDFIKQIDRAYFFLFRTMKFLTHF